MKWIKASEKLPNYADLFICRLEHNDGNGVRSQWVEELKYSLGETFIRDEYLKGDVIEWLDESHPEQGEQGEVYKWVNGEENKSQHYVSICCRLADYPDNYFSARYDWGRKTYRATNGQDYSPKEIEWLCKLSSPPPEGQDELWEALFEQTQIWYGDIQKKETYKEFLNRMAQSYLLIKK